MGIIRAIKQTVGGTLADQWLEVIEPENMGGQTVLTAGVRTGKRSKPKRWERYHLQRIGDSCI